MAVAVVCPSPAGTAAPNLHSTVAQAGAQALESQAPPPSAHACSAAAQTMGQSMGAAALLTLSPAYALTAGFHHTCGLRGDDQVICWGGNGNQQSSPPGGSFAAVTAGEDHSCWLRGDGQAVCWGGNSHQRSSPPGGSFAAVTAGAYHSCGLPGATTATGGPARPVAALRLSQPAILTHSEDND